MLPALPDEAIEGILLTFETLVNVSDAATRPVGAEILRQAAVVSAAPARRELILKAAEAVARGQPSGLTVSQAVADQTMTKDQWEQHIAEHPLPPLPGDLPEEISDEEDEEDEQEDPENPPYMDEEPPTLPDLPVRFFFPGLVVRVARDFSDAYGRAVSSKDLLRLINCVHEKGEYAMTCMDRNIRLKPAQAEIIENAENSFFQPVPTTECLEDLLAAIEMSLGEAEEDEDADIDRIELLHDEIDKCEAWIAESTPRPPAPHIGHGKLAGRLFGPDHELACWTRLLFAAVSAG